MICVPESTVNDARTEPTRTFVASPKFVPVRTTVLPTGPLPGAKLVILGFGLKIFEFAD